MSSSDDVSNNINEVGGNDNKVPHNGENSIRKIGQRSQINHLESEQRNGGYDKH